MLLSSGERREIVDEARRLATLAAEYLNIELVDLDSAGSLENVEFELAIVVGGDGSILRASHLMGRRQRPVVGVNLGRLGFLADLSPADFLAHLPAIATLELPVVEHLMLDCRLMRGETIWRQQLGLNEVAIFAGPPFAVLEIDLYVDAELATTYSCDGLIVSTPVGSTAHNLSAGGPILRKNLQAVVISPISPHTLTNRPVVDTADRVYELRVRRPHPGTTLVCDGKTMSLVEIGDRVLVRRADVAFGLVKSPDHSYYRTLRDKLGWGGQLRFNGESPR